MLINIYTLHCNENILLRCKFSNYQLRNQREHPNQIPINKGLPLRRFFQINIHIQNTRLFKLLSIDGEIHIAGF